MKATPYYDRDGITIWHADCRDILPTIDPASVDLLLTDPPYGIDYYVAPQIVGKGSRRILMGGRPRVIGDAAPFDPSHLRGFKRRVLWGAHNYADALPRSNGWIVWDKTGGGRGPNNTFSDVELAWTNVTTTPQIYRHLWKGLVRDSEAGHRVLHPTQKPVALMAWILERWTKSGDLILDPYMGSGPVARACQLLGRRYIGIELVEDYCKAAINRLAQPSMFQEAS